MKLIPNCLVSLLVMKRWYGINNDNYLDTPIGSVERSSKCPKRVACLSVCEEWEVSWVLPLTVAGSEALLRIWSLWQLTFLFSYLFLHL